MPFFSIVIPVFNRSTMLKNCLLSVLKQSFSDYEIIVVNDGSTDDTLEMIEKYFGMENHLRIITQQNNERGAARNNGFRNARGRYVVFLDSDDLMFVNHLSVLHQKIEEQNRPDFIASKFSFLRNGKRVDAPVCKYPEGKYDYKLFLSGNHLACNICVKRDNPSIFLFEEDRKYAIKEDWMFLMQNLRNNFLFLIDTISITMIDHEQRSMRSDNKLIVDKTWLAVNWIEKNIQLDTEEKMELNAHANYFSAIHSYIDFDNAPARLFLKNACRINGLQMKYVVLYFKTLLGYRLLKRLTQ